MRIKSLLRNSFARGALLLSLIAAMLIIAACGQSGSGNDSGGSPDGGQVGGSTPGTTAGDQDGAGVDDDAVDVIAVDAWVGRAPRGDMTAAYFTIINGADDAVVLTSVVAEAAAIVEIHETRALGEDDGHHHADDADGHHDAHHDHDHHDHHDHGVVMLPVEAVTVPARSEIAFEPGGLHVMLMDLQEDLNTGDVIALELQFADGRAITVDAEVR